MTQIPSMVVGTAGHIDHGKSSLVRALTGIDPDRLAEEKRRGITLDLGFAHLAMDWGHLFLVDVPGHEDLIRNMLAGIGGLDALILVVAADAGVMPQTREHFEIAKLLGAERGVVVLTKADLVDDEGLLLAEADVQDLIQDSFLASAPILAVSTKTGQGLEELKAALGRLYASLPPRNLAKPFRLPVDRSFTLKGFGTLVTGTAIAGSYVLGAELWQYPQQRPLKVRGMQAGGQNAQQVSQGQRVALNLVGLEKEEIQRGDQIASPGSLQVTRRLEVAPQWLGSTPPKHRSQLFFYSRAQESACRLLDLGEGYYRLELAKPLALAYEDPFILRSTDQRRTLGGGKVLGLGSSRERRLRTEIPRLLSELAKGEMAALLQLRGQAGLAPEECLPNLGLGEKKAEKLLQELSSQQQALLLDAKDRRYYSIHALERLGDFFQRALAQFHQKEPERPGAPAEYFFGKLKNRFSAPEVLGLLKWAQKQNYLAKVENFYHLLDFQGSLNEQQQKSKAWLVERLAHPMGHLESLHTLAEEGSLQVKDLERLCKLGTQDGWLLRIQEGLYQLPSAWQQVRSLIVACLQQAGELSVIDFKEKSGFSRKDAVAWLEFADQEKLTLRVENHRILR